MIQKVKKTLSVDSAYGIRITQNMIDSYNIYLEKHLISVYLAWKQVRAKLDKYKSDLRTVHYLLSIHDKSKYEDTEYIPYLIKYYAKESNSESEAAYDEAWERHYSSNPHHWRYWALGDTPKEIPNQYMIEMLLNWHAKSERIPELTAYNQYQEEKDSLILNESTRSKVESLIDFFKEPVVIPTLPSQYFPIDPMSGSGVMTTLINNIDSESDSEYVNDPRVDYAIVDKTNLDD